MYVEWADTSLQEIVVPWTVIEYPADGFKFAASLIGYSIRRGRHTSISSAINFGVRKLRKSRFRASRQVIDISGDGVNNQDRMVTKARDEAIAQDITINGLPIMLKRPDPDGSGLESLDRYFRQCVIGGPGAFLIPVTKRSQLAEAIREKIVREVADLPQFQSLNQLARDERTRCFHDPCSEEGSFC
jgi:Arc/MetJ-type ribon-helix-helix transcriptional regulator